MNTTSFIIIISCVFMTLYGVSTENVRLTRIKRQSNNPGDAFVDAVFQIPIQTLTSVGTLLKATRPVVMQVRQRIQQNLASQPQRFSFPGRPQVSQTSYQRPQVSQNRYQRPTSAYNRLHRRSGSRSSPSNNQFFRDSNSV